MKLFSANYIFPVNSVPIKNGIIVLDDNNYVVEIIDPKGDCLELESMEFHNGIIVPGFVNTHCHLELSHLKNKLGNVNKGIAGFVSQIRALRVSSEEEIKSAIKQGIQTLEQNGTVAVGDICNTSDSFSVKQLSKLHFHNFIELFGLLADDAEFRFINAKNILNEALLSNKTNSLSPHAAYSISNRLWKLINEELKKSNSIVSIHYGESQQEYDFLLNRSGSLAESFMALGIADGIASKTTPFNIIKEYIPKHNPILFIHNTFAQRNEILDIISYFDKPFFILCPSSNLFIEDRLPDVLMLRESGACVALGTDSYASSNTLSIFEQTKIIMEKFPDVPFNEIMQWATYNGAKALGVEHIYGSFEKGKKPGLNLITNIDFSQMKPTSQSRVKRLV